MPVDFLYVIHILFPNPFFKTRVYCKFSLSVIPILKFLATTYGDTDGDSKHTPDKKIVHMPAACNLTR